ncbi:MAG: glycosyltransferase family A protein [Candidatus Paceibacterota bacterium]|jgi:glycosyltransferase involved in cell wall biosynthesis
MANPKISVLIATYNRSNLISRAIQSVIDQNFKNWELLIADDGSTDDTEKIVRSFAIQDERVKHLKSEHFGRIAKISNFGLRHAKGEYIAILDDDDHWCDPEKLNKQIKFLDENPDYAGCGGGFIVVDENQKVKMKFFKPEKDEEIKKNFLIANPMANSTTMFRLSVAKKVELYDEALPQFADWDFWLKMGVAGKLYNFPEYFSYYLMWDKSMSFSRQKEASYSALIIIPRYKKKYPSYLKAKTLVLIYYLYTHLPEFIKKFLNPILSNLKKIIFSGRSAHPFE